MWQPANKAALPSPGDFRHAKKAINELEDVLKDALAVLEQAQLRVLALTKELDERKAWIAPIRKLPSELLSEIFIFGSEMRHLAPVTITEVSRLWRAVVLATPRAWSLIYANAPEHELHLNQYVSTFVERSNPCLLHIWIRDDLDYDSDEYDYEPPENKALPLLWASLSRIQCLCIGSSELRKLSEKCMPNLARLMITDYGDIPFFINCDQFPLLRSIQSTNSTWGNSVSLTSFPPLQELAIRVTRLPTWLDVVKNCSATLKALVIVGLLKWTERVTIIFPRLQSLTLSDRSSGLVPEDWSISMVTPDLISYDESSISTTSSRLRHGDVKSVIYLRIRPLPDLAPYTIRPLPDLAPYTSLRVLQLSPTYNLSFVAGAGELAARLKQDISASPALELVEFCLPSLGEPGPELQSAMEDVIEEIKSARPGIEVSFTHRFSPMPGSIEETSCQFGMPCSYKEF